MNNGVPRKIQMDLKWEKSSPERVRKMLKVPTMNKFAGYLGFTASRYKKIMDNADKLTTWTIAYIGAKTGVRFFIGNGPREVIESGQQLAKLREELKMSQRKFAAYSNLAVEQVFRAEHSKSTVGPRLSTALILSKAFGKSLHFAPSYFPRPLEKQKNLTKKVTANVK